MGPENRKSGGSCRKFDIGAYLDGELPLQDELMIEEHFTRCAACSHELNIQKRMLSAIDSAFAGETEALEIPADFARTVTANAESNVSGIRKPGERYRAALAAVTLLFLVSVSLATDAGAMALTASQKVVEQSFSVIGFGLHFIYETGIGFGVVLRCLGSGVLFGSAASAVLALILFVVSTAVLSVFALKSVRSSKV